MWAEDFMSRRPHIDVIVQGGGSGVGIAHRRELKRLNNWP
jgi:ABC-type phosphate transport system substrate-binding protein